MTIEERSPEKEELEWVEKVPVGPIPLRIVALVEDEGEEEGYRRTIEGNISLLPPLLATTTTPQARVYPRELSVFLPPLIRILFIILLYND